MGPTLRTPDTEKTRADMEVHAVHHNITMLRCHVLGEGALLTNVLFRAFQSGARHRGEVRPLNMGKGAHKED